MRQERQESFKARKIEKLDFDHLNDETDFKPNSEIAKSPTDGELIGINYIFH